MRAVRPWSYCSYGVSKILKSRNSQYPAGRHVTSVVTRWSKNQVTKRATIEALEKATIWNLVEDEPNVPLMHYMGPLANVNLFKYGEPKKGETLFVSGASGAVGQAVIIWAKSFGLRVIGSAGSDEKVAHCLELGCDAAFNYKKPPGVSALKSIASNGLDIYFDKVGGETFDAALARMKPFGRMPICGTISNYNLASGGSDYSITNGRFIVPNRLMIRGFIVRDDRVEWIARVFDDVKQQIREGKWKAYKVDVRNGLEAAPGYFVGMLRGDKKGKAIMQL